MALLRARLLEAEQQKQAAQQAPHERRLQVGSGDRSERIRTYNFPQARITDHRINLTIYRLAAVLDGELDEVIDPLQQEWQAEQPASLGRMPWRPRSARCWTKARPPARVAGDDARGAEVLLADALGRNRAWLARTPDDPDPRLRGHRPLRGASRASCARRAGRLPARPPGVLVAVVRGGAVVLVPRPDTELVVERALVHLPADHGRRSTRDRQRRDRAWSPANGHSHRDRPVDGRWRSRHRMRCARARTRQFLPATGTLCRRGPALRPDRQPTLRTSRSVIRASRRTCAATSRSRRCTRDRLSGSRALERVVAGASPAPARVRLAGGRARRSTGRTGARCCRRRDSNRSRPIATSAAASAAPKAAAPPDRGQASASERAPAASPEAVRGSCVRNRNSRGHLWPAEARRCASSDAASTGMPSAVPPMPPRACRGPVRHAGHASPGHRRVLQQRGRLDR